MEFLEEETRPRFLFQIASLPLQIQTKKPQNSTKSKPSVSLPSPSPSSSPSSTFPPIPKPPIPPRLDLPLPPPRPLCPHLHHRRRHLYRKRGPPPPPSDPDPVSAKEPKKRISGRRSKPRRPDDHPSSNPIFPIPEPKNPEPKIVKSNQPNGGSRLEVEEEWMDEDFDLLKNQIAKHLVGAPRRWEVIAEAFRGRHGLESVIKTAKSMAEKRPGGSGGDDFAQFLKQRKPLNKQAPGFNGELVEQTVVFGENGDLNKESGSLNWSSGEDIALLNALKAFPKDVPMRWEKIAAAVPGKSKACCMKRVPELKRDFRSSKASEAT